MYTIISIAFVACIALATIFLGRRMIFNKLAARQHTRRLATIFSPKGANSHLFSIDLVEGDGILYASKSFKHELAGWHQLGLIVEHEIRNPIDNPIHIDLKCDIEIPGKSVALLHGKTALMTPWWSGSGKNGFRLKVYAIPDDAPRGVEVTLRFRVNGLELLEKYGRVKVFIAPLNVW